MIFCIYADAITLNPLWCDTQSAVVVEKGVFNVLLGSQHPIPDSVFDGNVRYLGVKVGSDAEITPRKPMVSVAYAYTDGDWTKDGDNIYRTQGNVGIGTTNPGTLLTLSTVETDNATALTMGFGNRYGIGFNGEGAGHFNIFAHQTAIGIGIGFDTGDYGTFSEKVTIQNDGRVGIGTTDPQYKLDVAGEIHGTSFPTSSDTRFKTNITQLTDVLEKLEKIHGVSFDWNGLYQSLGRSSDHREIGVIAQEVEAVFPELVTTWGDEKYRAVDYGRLSAVLIEAIKELKAENEALKKRIEVLEER
jgi:hypothetical protein